MEIQQIASFCLSVLVLCDSTCSSLAISFSPPLANDFCSSTATSSSTYLFFINIFNNWSDKLLPVRALSASVNSFPLLKDIIA